MARKENFLKKYRDLEMRVHNEIRNKIIKSSITSEHCSEKCLKVDNIHFYTEIAIINDRLTFLDHDGYHYLIFDQCDLEDLIEEFLS